MGKESKIILLFFTLFQGLPCISQNRTNFIHLPFSPNYQNVRVTHSVQDSLGFVWLSHNTGISKFDGYNFEYFSSSNLFGKKASNDKVKRVFKDANGIIWALSQKGLLTYLERNGTFLPLRTVKGSFLESHKISLTYTDKNSFWLVTKKGSIFTYDHGKGILDSITTAPSNGGKPYIINSLVVANSGRIVLSTLKGPVYTYDHAKGAGKWEALKLPLGGREPDHNILLLDKKDRLWIGSSHVDLGLMVYDFKEGDFVQDMLFDANSKQLMKELFISMYCDSKGTIWLGTDGNGLYAVHPDTGAVQIHKHNDLNGFSLSSNTVLNINEDLRHNLWVLTNYGDINILQNADDNIRYHAGSINNKPTRVLSTYRATDGTLWIGTDGEGITTVSREGVERQFFSNTPKQKGFYIHAVQEAPSQKIWIGTYKNGLWSYDPVSKNFRKINLTDDQGIGVTDVRFIFRDSKDRIWMATDLGIFVYGSNDVPLAFFANNSRGLEGVISQSIIEDGKGRIWLAINGGGLFKLEENPKYFAGSHFLRQSYGTVGTGYRSEHDILSMASDKKGTIWIVTVNGDLVRFNTHNTSLRKLDLMDKHQNVTFRSVTVADSDNIWLGSSNGIWHYGVADSTSTIFYERDGLQHNFFMQRSVHKGRDGFLYFGGLHGVNYFRPEEIKKEPSVAKLLIEDVQILNQPAVASIPEQLGQGLANLRYLDLSYDQSSFSFRFLAMDNVLFPKYSYAYRLRGFQEEWIYTDNDRVATYTNIPPGDYRFEVKAGSEKDIWDVAPRTMGIHIAQPYWNSGWAHFIYLLLGGALFYGIAVWIRLKNQLHAEELQHRHEKEVYSLKMDFFAKMSHEIQTPLTLILIPLENMLEGAIKSGNVALRQRLRLIENNAKRLSRIVFELTSLRDKELEKLVLRPTKNNLVADLREIAESFAEHAQFKGMDFKCNFPGNALYVSYDRDKMEHVFFNLLSNAFKFTPRGGTISVDVRREDWEETVKISITDSGPGIPKEEFDNIFKLFYQSDHGKQKVGMGIGLALTKELVDLHHGKLDVKSDPRKGTCFSVSLPAVEAASPESLKAISRVGEDSVITSPGPEPEDREPEFSKSILIVEDNYELQISLNDIFGGYYKVLLAENGEEGYEMALTYLPDLIISDIMMPKLNGLDMSNKLQNNPLTTHIPIILLTAKKSSKNKILGLRAGAIEYIHKPFNINELVLKVKNIITRSDRLILKYKNDLISSPKSGTERSQDDVFLERLVDLIADRMGDPDFKLEELSNDLNMSYSAIYRKFQALTGKKIVDFVRTMRLKKAAVLITDCNYSISEASFMVGFNDPKYFSKCYKKEYGRSPGTLKRKIDPLDGDLEETS